MTDAGTTDSAVLDPAAASEENPQEDFDLDEYGRVAGEDYRRHRGNYEDFALVVKSLLQVAIDADHLKVQAIDARAKTEESFSTKASRAADGEGKSPKYKNPMSDIQDLAGCRVITFFLDNVQTVRSIIYREFIVIEMANRSSQLRGTGKPGYESYHFVVKMRDDRLVLPEYARFENLVAEIQVRTILQHAWAEIEHDIQYKSVDALPGEIGQRFQALAGLIEIGDREFQAIASAHESVRKEAAISLEQGRLAEVELTAESLKAYLDMKFGPDGRIRDWAYEWTASYLRKMNFNNLQELDDCIAQYDDDELSRVVWGSRQGQLTRFELVLLAGYGPDRFKAGHPWVGADGGQEWFVQHIDRQVEKLVAAGVEVAGA
jgi:ppGpp synthetase/RelA/SpoT-type nucleotidyltranferase